MLFRSPSLFGQRTGRSSAGIPPSPPSSPTRGGRAASDVDMQSDDYAAFPASDSNVGFEHGDMGMADVDMGYENVEDGLSEELEEIEGLNWEDEVSGFYLITLQSPIHSFGMSPASPNTIDSRECIKYIQNIPGSHEGAFGYIDVGVACGAVCKGMHQDSRGSCCTFDYARLGSGTV